MRTCLLLCLALSSFPALSSQWKIVQDYDFSGTSLTHSFVAFTTNDEYLDSGKIQWLRASFVCNKYIGDFLRFTVIHSKKQKGVIYWKAQEDHNWKVSEANFGKSPLVAVNSKQNAGYQELLSAMKASNEILISLDKVKTYRIKLKGFSSTYNEIKVLSNCGS
ncbi:hypothetical protein BCU43_006985 [Vibrio lentus]